jgi:hypothetical protein
MNDLVVMTERMSKRVDDIYNQPQPPAALARVTGSVTKSADNRMPGQGEASPISPEDLTKALASMSQEERTLQLIKAARATPMMTHGIHDGPGPWRPPVAPAKT